MTDGLKMIAQAKEYEQTSDRYRLELLVEGVAGLPPRYSVKAFHRKTYEEAIQKKITDTAKQGCFFNLEGLSVEETGEAIKLLAASWNNRPAEKSIEDLQHSGKTEDKASEPAPAAQPKTSQVLATGGTAAAK